MTASDGEDAEAYVEELSRRRRRRGRRVDDGGEGCLFLGTVRTDLPGSRQHPPELGLGSLGLFFLHGFQLYFGILAMFLFHLFENGVQ